MCSKICGLRDFVMPRTQNGYATASIAIGIRGIVETIVDKLIAERPLTGFAGSDVVACHGGGLTLKLRLSGAQPARSDKTFAAVPPGHAAHGLSAFS